MEAYFDDAGLHGVAPFSLAGTGHSCYRCVKAAEKRWRAWPFHKRPVRHAGAALAGVKPYTCAEPPPWAPTDKVAHDGTEEGECEARCLGDKRCKAWTLSSVKGQCCLYAYATGTKPANHTVHSKNCLVAPEGAMTSSWQVTGIVPVDPLEIALGSTTTNFALDMKTGVNTRNGNSNPYFRMADVSEPDQGYPRNRRLFRG